MTVTVACIESIKHGHGFQKRENEANAEIPDSFYVKLSPADCRSCGCKKILFCWSYSTSDSIWTIQIKWSQFCQYSSYHISKWAVICGVKLHGCTHLYVLLQSVPFLITYVVFVTNMVMTVRLIFWLQNGTWEPNSRSHGSSARFIFYIVYVCTQSFILTTENHVSSESHTNTSY